MRLFFVHLIKEQGAGLEVGVKFGTSENSTHYFFGRFSRSMMWLNVLPLLFTSKQRHRVLGFFLDALDLVTRTIFKDVLTQQALGLKQLKNF